jgi:hypothetical protein
VKEEERLRYMRDKQIRWELGKDTQTRIERVRDEEEQDRLVILDSSSDESQNDEIASYYSDDQSYR